MAAPGSSLGWGRSLLFASGDFACNLYWQSMTFYLLFFYTETLRLSAALAGLITLAASVWDGIASLLVGIAADRGGNRAFVRIGALPLALAFVLIYAPVGLHGPSLGAFALLAHMLFRTLYVAVNIPYATLTVRIARDTVSRSRVAGLRMILGAGAALAVAVGTQASVTATTSAGRPALAYMLAAAPFGVIATGLLFVVSGLRADAAAPLAARPDIRLGSILAAIAGNRAFVLLNLGICGAIWSMAILTRAIPYYFKYVVADAGAGAAALAFMSVAGVAAVPLWMTCAARLGHRRQWHLSAGLAALALAALLVMRPRSAPVAQSLFVLFQAGGQGLFFAFWALIPDAVEHGRRPGTVRMDTMLFGVAALVQKVGLGVAVATFGGLLSASGYAARDVQPALVVRSLELLTAALPLLGLLVTSAAMRRFPWTHAARD